MPTDRQTILLQDNIARQTVVFTVQVLLSSSCIVSPGYMGKQMTKNAIIKSHLQNKGQMLSEYAS